ncbi:MAG: ABC transporter permease, partial [Egibacteraceae bacterium]
MSALTHVARSAALDAVRRGVARTADAGLVVWVVVGAMIAVSAAQSDLFMTERNIANALGQMVVLGLVTLGQTFVILAGAIDLSVGATVKLANVLTAGLIDGESARVLPVVVLVLCTGALVGFVNGLLSTRLRVAPIIVTLGTFSVLQGLAFAYTTTPVGRVTPGMARLAFATVGPLPLPFLLFAVLAASAAWLLRSTVFGRRVYAVGGDAELARKAGINSRNVMVVTMTICSTLAALGGVVQATRAGVGTPTAGDGLELAA